MNKAFVDTDIALDMLMKREPHYKSAALLFSLADRSILKLYVSSLCFTNINYLLRRNLSLEGSRRALSNFKILVNVLSVDDKIIELALASSFNDFEDAVQYHTATQNKIPILLTRNLKDYKKAAIPVMNAESFLKTL